MFRFLLWGGVAIMVAALLLSFALPPSRLRFGVTAVVGLLGWGVASLAKNFKRLG